MPHKSGSGAILGITSEEGVVSQKRVTLMDRSNMSVVRHAVSDEHGAYYFTGLNPDTNDYIVMCVDDDGSPKKAAIIFDYVQPIPAHQGGFFWGNWFTLSMRKKPIASVLAIPDSDTAASSSYNSGVGLSSSGNIGVLNFASPSNPLLGAPDLPVLSFNNNMIAKHAVKDKNLLTTGDALAISCEWVLDLSSFTVGVVAIQAYRAHRLYVEGGDYGALTLLRVAYDTSTKNLSLYLQRSGTPIYSDTPQTGSQLLFSYALPVSLQTATSIHIAASVIYGNTATLYVNGQQVQTQSITSFPAHPITTDQHKVIVTSISSLLFAAPTNQYTSPITGKAYLYAFYSDPMTGQEALAHYQALTEDTQPLVTGYERAVFSDYPQHMYRLNDTVSSDISVDALSPNATINSSSTLSKEFGFNAPPAPELSLVVGGVGKIFDGNSVLSNPQHAILPNNYLALSVSFFAKPSIGSMSVDGSVILFRDLSVAQPYPVYLQIAFTPAGKLRVSWIASSNSTAVSNIFSYTVDANNVHYYAVSANVSSKELNLYVDAILVETIPIAGAFAIMPPVSLRLGSNFSVGSQYKGYLSEISLFPRALTQNDFQKHYEARLTI